MDKLTAYEILRIMPGCPPEKVKEAYVILSKEFHPEEYPEEFQRIHEAYTLLTRGDKRGRRKVSQSIDFEETKSRKTQKDVVTTFDFESDNHENEQEDKQEEKNSYNFEDVLNKAEENEKAKAHELTLQALAELKVILMPYYRQNFLLFQNFFNKIEYKEIFHTPGFMKQLAELLKNTRLKKIIYEVMLSYYDFENKNPSDLTAEIRELYDVLYDKYKVNKKPNIQVIIFITLCALVGIYTGLRAAIQRGISFTDIFQGLVVLIMLGKVYIWIYKVIYKKNSSIFAQFMVALIIFVSQLLAAIFDFNVLIFRNVHAGDTFAMLLMILSFLWMLLPVVSVLIVKNHKKIT